MLDNLFNDVRLYLSCSGGLGNLESSCWPALWSETIFLQVSAAFDSNAEVIKCPRPGAGRAGRFMSYRGLGETKTHIRSPIPLDHYPLIRMGVY